MTDRLTIDQCRVGMRVRCVDGSGLFEEGDVVTIEKVDPPFWLIVTGCGYRDKFVHCRRFAIYPAPQPAMTPELLAALLRTYHLMMARSERGGYLAAHETEMRDAIERAGILAEPAPPLPRAPVPDAMWCGADAFGEDG